jgi:hypothetical protein
VEARAGARRRDVVVTPGELDAHAVAVREAEEAAALRARVEPVVLEIGRASLHPRDDVRIVDRRHVRNVDRETVLELFGRDGALDRAERAPFTRVVRLHDEP